MSKDAVLLNSGGIDSRVTAKLLKDEGYTLHSLFIDFNKQISNKSNKSAKETADLYCVDHFVFKYPVDWAMQKSETHYGTPFVAMAVHAIACQYAAFKGYQYVVAGTRSEGRGKVYLDNLRLMINKALQTKPVTFVAPLYFKEFDEVITLAKEHKVDLKDTHSCGSHPSCGKCGPCMKRKRVNL